MQSKKAKERMLLIILVFAAACYGFYTLLLSPKMAQVAVLKSQVEADDMIVRDLYASVQQYTTDAEQLRNIHEQTKTLAMRFYADSRQEDYLEHLNMVLKKDGIAWQEIGSEGHVQVDLTAADYRCDSPYLAYASVTEEELAAMEEDPDQLFAVLEEAMEEGEMPETEQMTIQVELTGPYQSVKSVIAALEQSQRHVICDGLTITAEDGAAGMSQGTNPNVTTLLSLKFLRLPDLNDRSVQTGFTEMPQTFVMPDDFISGSYRTILSLPWLSWLF